MFAGIKVEINGEDVIIPPLSLGQLRNGMLKKLQEHDELIGNGKTFESMEIRGDIILEAIRRNYPKFSAEVLFNFLDLQNTGPIWLAILGASGFNMGEAEAAKLPISGT